ncbi:MAG TPA: M20/M25/M40 family metallo-hydrolase [Pseudonocardiaceae bacterium]|nr:M20/M25/M40 family metallo-hydrolase [Pseudonocardiaceae bacterium]
MRADRWAEDALATLRGLVAIPSPSGDERRAAGWLADRMTALGYRTGIDAVGNVVGELGSGRTTIMMVGHIDTVPGELPVRQAGDVLFGRGSVDAKGPLAAMVHAGARAAAELTDARLVVIGAVDEERVSRGARYLCASMDRPDVLLIGEPSGVASVVVGYKGMLRFEYRVRRPPAHSSSPAERAVEVAADVWLSTRGTLVADGPDLSAFRRAIPALLALDGDPTSARARIACRTPEGFNVESFLDRVRGLADGGEITVLERVPAVRTSRADPLVRALTSAVRRVAGVATAKVKLGTSDMNVLVPHWGVPAVAYGPGDSALDHTDDEHLRLDEYLLAIDVLTEALPAIAAVPAGFRASAMGG